MAGYKRNPKIYLLKFDETTDYPGLEVQVRTLSMGQLVQVWTGEGDGSSAATFEMFVERLVGWNLEDEVTGEPVPITREAIEAEDDDLVNAIIKRWTAAVLGVPAPLDGGSNSGGLSAAESALTEIPSQSLAS
ncbi:hypothetical protein [Actinacidiphila rubida]|uniref:Uncharacterized protein n=1 Tax=Actinacidiphila rubida TaxID=310780 RepID=A0A1H8SY50_9ACTN|nr:hypothetical protein [Actinacidiphila rubida]SEO83567.1 hypothetical protein SAMN05216267_104652 [Actinacidiphila rubida]